MIEFQISYWDEGVKGLAATPTAVSAVFLEESGKRVVDVAMTNGVRMSPADWDAKRQYLNEHAHSDWSTAYGGTSMREDLQPDRMSSSSMMAIGALHLLTPESAQVAQLEVHRT
jgi:hypothetical protein